MTGDGFITRRWDRAIRSFFCVVRALMRPAGCCVRREFRLLLEGLCYFNRIWHRFEAIDSDGDRTFLSSSCHHYTTISSLPRHCHVPSAFPVPFCVAMPLCSCLTFCMTLLACSRAVCPACPALWPFRAAIAARVCERLRRAGDTPAARAGGACVSGDGC